MHTVWPVARIEAERRRLEVLRYLARIPGYETSAMILREHCRSIGVPTTTDQMRACIHWLAEQDLITTRGSDDDPIPRLTTSGRETAQGYRRHPGVMQPDP
ncbi:MAG: hypothetical protein ACPGSW_04535 [Phaeobacter italicus]